MKQSWYRKRSKVEWVMNGVYIDWHEGREGRGVELKDTLSWYAGEGEYEWCEGTLRMARPAEDTVVDIDTFHILFISILVIYSL